MRREGYPDHPTRRARIEPGTIRSGLCKGPGLTFGANGSAGESGYTCCPEGNEYGREAVACAADF